MSGQRVDVATWSRREVFKLFRSYDRPHYAITARIDVSRLMRDRKATGLSPFRVTMYAIGAGLAEVPALRMRFRGDVVTQYEDVHLSPAIPLDTGEFGYAYLPWQPDRATFDADVAKAIAAIRAGQPLNANQGQIENVAYLSCLPWLDYTSLDNALPGRDDCIPRISWGKIVPTGNGHDMAMTLQVHHALVDGRHAGVFFDATQAALNTT